MLVLYVALLLLLALVQVAVRWRVTCLERRFVRIAAQADALLNRTGFRPGNTNKVDPLVAARQQYELAQIALKRDRVESRYTTWQAFSEKFACFRHRLAGFKGKVVPYAVGVLDVAGGFVVLEQFGLTVGELRNLLGM